LAGWINDDHEVLRTVDAVSNAADQWNEAGRSNNDLYRGDRLGRAAGIVATSPDRLRPLDTQFIEASREHNEAEEQREQRRVKRLRLLLAGTAAALVVALIAAGLAINSQRQATASEQEAIAATADAQSAAAEADASAAEAEASALAATAATAEAELATIISRSASLTADEPELSILLALEANRRSPGRETNGAVLNTLGSGTILDVVAQNPFQFVEGQQECVRLSTDRERDLSVVDGNLATRDSLTGDIRTHGPVPDGGRVCWQGDEALDRVFVQEPPGIRAWVGSYDSPAEVELSLEDLALEPEGLIEAGPFQTSNRLLLADSRTITTIDDRTGEVIGVPVVVGGDEIEFLSMTPSIDGSIVAMTFLRDNSVSGDGVGFSGVIVVFDAFAGEEILRIESDSPAAPARPDSASNLLFAIRDRSSLVTFDLQSGELLHEVDLQVPRAFDVMAASEQTVVVAGNGEVQFVDYRTGAVERSVELRNVEQALFRNDGLLNTFTTDGQLSTIDLDGSALLAETHSLPSSNNVTVVNGLAGVVNPTTAETEVIDLATGERTRLDLTTGDGEVVSAGLAYPTSDGTWVIDDSGISRWVNGRRVEQLDRNGVAFLGNFFRDFYADIRLVGDDDYFVDLISLQPGKLEVAFTIPFSEDNFTPGVHPTADGGLLTVGDQGLSRYDNTGNLVDRMELEIPGAIMGLDADGTQLAVAGVGALIVDLETGDVQSIPQDDEVFSVSFANGGDLLALTTTFGNVRLWDVAEGVSLGLAFEGFGQATAAKLQNDPDADSMWMVSSDTLLEIPIRPEIWVERACDAVGRDMTQEEWDRVVPGGGPVQSACN